MSSQEGDASQTEFDSEGGRRKAVVDDQAALSYYVVKLGVFMQVLIEEHPEEYRDNNL